MNFRSYLVSLLSLSAALPAFATVVVNSPSNGTTVNPTVSFVASASTSTCSKGVAAMGVYIDSSLKYVVNGTSLKQNLVINPGQHSAVIEEWDYCGGATTQALTLIVNGQASVAVTSPVQGSTVPTSTLFAATATSNCPGGVTAMGVYLGSKLVYKSAGPSLSTTLTLPSGLQKPVVQEWDACGGSTLSPVTVTVQSTVVVTPITPSVPSAPVVPTPPAPVTPPTTSVGTKLSALQAVPSWNQWGEYPPVYDICNAPCSGISWAMTPHQTAVSLSGNATRFDIGGSHPYSDVLWSNKLIGVASTLGQFDQKHLVLPTVHHMTFDADIFPTNMSVTQDVELDVNLFMNGVGMEWGTECNNLNGKVWDYWDNVNGHWIHTGIPCDLKDNTWNHVTFTTSRTANNDLVYETLTQNGVTYNMNITVPPFPVPSDWYGMTVNYQLDGDKYMSANTQYVDNLNVTYW